MLLRVKTESGGESLHQDGGGGGGGGDESAAAAQGVFAASEPRTRVCPPALRPTGFVQASHVLSLAYVRVFLLPGASSADGIVCVARVNHMDLNTVNSDPYQNRGSFFERKYSPQPGKSAGKTKWRLLCWPDHIISDLNQQQLMQIVRKLGLKRVTEQEMSA